MNRDVIPRLYRTARRFIDKCEAPTHRLLFEHGMLGAVVICGELLTDGEWLEEHDMHCIRRLDLGELTQDHLDWARCELNFYSTALLDKPSAQRFHPWLYNKLRMAVHVYATLGLLLLGYAVWLTFQNEWVVAALRDFRGRVHTWDKVTRWGKRLGVAEMLRHNTSLGLYAADIAVTLYFAVVDSILMMCVLLTFDPWTIKLQLGERDILDPSDVAVTSFPPLAWCDVSQETGRLEGTYSYNCEVAANNTYVQLVVFLAAALTSMWIKTMAALLRCLLMALVPPWRRAMLGTPVALSTGRTMDMCLLGRYTTLRGFRVSLREEVRERQGKRVMKRELFPYVDTS